MVEICSERQSMNQKVVKHKTAVKLDSVADYDIGEWVYGECTSPCDDFIVGFSLH